METKHKLITTLLLLALPTISWGDDSALEMSLEDLLNVKVVSASRREESLSKIPAAIKVITRDDIAKSTARNIPELLRQVPGLQVAQIDANKWAVSARGFNSQFANKLLVLVDGRSVYTPIFSGTYWFQDDLPLEEIERIEVIRGPGGAVWGSNAVNGVINIISRSAKDTKGQHLRIGGGSPRIADGYARSGFELSESYDARLWAEGKAISQFKTADNISPNDQSNLGRVGINIDGTPAENQNLRLSALAYRAKTNSTSNWITPPTFTRQNIETNDKGDGLALGSHWDIQNSKASTINVDLNYLLSNRVDLQATSKFSSYDLHLQHDYKFNDRLAAEYGGGLRVVNDDFSGSVTSGTTFDQTISDLNIYNLFFQTNYQILPDLLTATIGSKFEYHTFVGLNIQPTVRLALTPNERNTFWGAYSRAARVPSRAERDITVSNSAIFTDPTTGLPGSIGLQTNNNLHSEISDSFELGYRGALTPELTLDISSFYTHYEGLIGANAQSPIFDPTKFPALFIPYKYANNFDADVHGVEIGLESRPLDYLRLRTSYTLFQLSASGSNNALANPSESANPENQFAFHVGADLTSRLSWENSLFAYESMLSQNTDTIAILDSRLSYKVQENFRINLLGQNLLQTDQPQYGSPALTTRTSIPRGFFIWLEWDL
jgi:iron complex outermembrane receptor protein